MNRIRRVAFVGSKSLGLRVLKELHSLSPETLICAITIDDGNDTRSVFPEFKEFADDIGLKLYVPGSRRQSEEILRELKPELCLVVGWYWLIGDAALGAAAHGFIGVHNSLLPRFRGGSPLIWPILNDEKEVGLSFFSLTSGMDDGAIWGQGAVSVEEDDYISDILKKLEEKTIEILREKYLRILDLDVGQVEQDHALATYCAQRFPSDGNIDWHKSARDVFNFIRAQSDPYPASYTYLGSQVLKIWRAHVFDRTYFGTPGQVAKVSDEGVYVVCGNNQAIILEDVELDGRRGSAHEFIKSIRIRLSDLPKDSSNG